MGDYSSLIGVAIGGGITLLANVVTQGFALYQQSKNARIQRQTELWQKRLVAMQNCVRMIDFLTAAKNADLGPGGLEEWTRIRMENTCNGALFPIELASEFKETIRLVLLRDTLHDSEEWLDFERLEKLRADCIRFLEREFK